MRSRQGWRGLSAASVVAAVAAAGALALPGSDAAERPRVAAKRPNICLDREIRNERGLKCPDLRMRPPYDLDRAMIGSKPVLRAANSIDSVGRGPAELHGRRTGPRTMKADQKVQKRGGKEVRFANGARLAFKLIPGQGRYWKFKDAAKFTLWRLDDEGERVRRVEVGPKQIYCLRDLERTHPRMDHSPANAQYPACSQNPDRQKVTLGTSVGWSDIYPYSYHENYIEIDDIPSRGCYAFVHIADPQDGIYELNEDNNEASTVVYLTRSGRYKPRRCRGVRDQSLPRSQTIDDSELSGVGGGGGPYPPYPPYPPRAG